MAIKPLALRSLSSTQLQAGNLLCGRSASLSTQFYGQPMEISLLPESSAADFDMALVFRVDGADIPVHVNRSLFAGVTIGSTKIETVLDSMPELLLKGCLQLVLERTIKDLRSLLQKEIRLQEVRFSTELPDASLSVLLNVHGVSNHGRIGVNSQVLSWLDSLPFPEPARIPENIPLLLTLEAGRTRLSSRQIEQLHIHDVIFFDKNWYAQEKVLVRLAATHAFIGKLTENTITLMNSVEVPVSGDDNMDDLDAYDDDFDDELDDGFGDDPDEEKDLQAEGTQPAQNPSSVTPDTHSIPVQLTFDIGKQEILLGNMAQLVPGFTFQLNRPVASPVIIHANGKPLAEGELVDVNGQLGTRIKRML